MLFAFKFFSLPVPTRPGTRTFLQVADPSRPEVKNPYPSDPGDDDGEEKDIRMRSTMKILFLMMVVVMLLNMMMRTTRMRSTLNIEFMMMAMVMIEMKSSSKILLLIMLAMANLVCC